LGPIERKNMPARVETGENFRSEEEKSPLNDHQLKILRLVALGLTNPEIAARLSLSPSTIRSHLSRREDVPGIYWLLDVYSRREAVVKIIEEFGELDPLELVSTEESARCESLTERQLEVLSWFASPELPLERSPYLEISKKLGGLAYNTIKNHLKSINRTLRTQYEVAGISITRATVIYLAYKRRKEATSPSHETPHELNGAGG
jgi:DNA-binding NarL/FixJ family response regulator